MKEISSDKIKESGMGGSSGTECIVRKPKGKRPGTKPKHRLEANIETDLKTG
jgi:hypothetical protein